MVAPLSTLMNWNREVGMWTDGKMTSMVYHGSADVRTEMRTRWHDVDVVITSFEIVMRDIRQFQVRDTPAHVLSRAVHGY